jgi:signal transduction histidine kinase
LHGIPSYRSIGFVFWIAISSFVSITVLLLGLAQAGLMTWASTNQVATLQLAQTEISSDRVADSLRTTKTLIRQLSAQTHFLSTDAQRLLELKRLLAIEPNIRSIVFRSDRAGVTYSVNRFGRDIVQSDEASPRPRALDRTGTGEVNFSEVEYRENITPVVRFRHSVGGAYSTHGEVALTALTNALFELKLHAPSSVYVVDGESRVIADRNLARALTREVSNALAPSSTFFWRPLGPALPPGTWFADANDGRHSLVSASPISGTPWRLVIERPLSDVLAPLREALVNVLAFTAIAMMLAIGLARWLSKRIARPIVAVKQAADKIARGDFNVSLADAPSSELQSLVKSIEHMAKQLTTAYQSMDSEIKKQTAEANRANQHKSDFLAHMSHELRTPLNAVIGFSEMLDARYFGPLNDKQAEYVRDIHQSGQHLLSLINDILDLAKIESGRVELAGSLVDIAALVESCRALTSERFHRKRQTLEIQLELDQSHWFLDARKIKQCIINLLSNANKFTAEEKRVVLRVSTSVSSLTVVVKDEGIGIPSDALPHLFSEFFQVTESTGNGENVSTPNDANWRPDGTGLGLSLTKRFIELHGGTITVRSVVNVGSEFVIVIPKINPSGQPTSV